MEHASYPVSDIPTLYTLLEAREKQITTLAKLLAEVNEKLVDIETSNEALAAENAQLEEKLLSRNTQMIQEECDMDLIRARIESLEKKNNQLEMKISYVENPIPHHEGEEAADAENKENVDSNVDLHPKNQKTTKRSWSFWRKKSGEKIEDHKQPILEEKEDVQRNVNMMLSGTTL